ncbi:hypothetical protein LTR12_016054 [Friedmanniomyces endolithicus]|nr:hypothetical protein LTR12_016054 [Friedmanniomyces endolithicus]
MMCWTLTHLTEPILDTVAESDDEGVLEDIVGGCGHPTRRDRAFASKRTKLPRVVTSLTIFTSSLSTPIASKNRSSAVGGNVTVKNTNCVSFSAISHNNRTCGRNVSVTSNTALVTADSGVTNTTRALCAGRFPSLSLHTIPVLSQLSRMSCRNAVNGTTTIVTPPLAAAAGNTKHKLFPPPVRMMINTLICLAPYLSFL